MVYNVSFVLLYNILMQSLWAESSDCTVFM